MLLRQASATHPTLPPAILALPPLACLPCRSATVYKVLLRGEPVAAKASKLLLLLAPTAARSWALL